MSEQEEAWTEDQRAVLESRASRLLGSLDRERASPHPSVVVVSTAGVEVAFPASIVLGVRRLRTLTVVHSGPPTLLGVFAYGELVLPAFQLSCMLGLPRRPSERPFLVIVGRTAPELGFEVDRVVSRDVVTPQIPSGSTLGLSLCGQTPSGVPVLDAEALFHTPSLAVS